MEEDRRVHGLGANITYLRTDIEFNLALRIKSTAIRFTCTP
jgi:hypothetical protein